MAALSPTIRSSSPAATSVTGVDALNPAILSGKKPAIDPPPVTTAVTSCARVAVPKLHAISMAIENAMNLYFLLLIMTDSPLPPKLREYLVSVMIRPTYVGQGNLP